MEQEEELTALRVLDTTGSAPGDKPSSMRDQLISNVDQFGSHQATSGHGAADNSSENSGSLANPRKIHVSPIVHVGGGGGGEQETGTPSTDIDLNSPSTSKENAELAVVRISKI